jgi:MoxR-like ATPase
VVQTAISPALEYYLVQLVVATSYPHLYDRALTGAAREGAGPRGAAALDRCARAHAWLRGRDRVRPEDIHAVATDVLRHRVTLSEAALDEGLTPDSYLERLLAALPPI